MPNYYDSKLGQDTGQTPERRNEEATKIVAMMYDNIMIDYNNTPKNEIEFLWGLFDAYKKRGKVFVTGKQLMWLRDLKEKYL